jgi:hypothetical protein
LVFDSVHLPPDSMRTLSTAEAEVAMIASLEDSSANELAGENRG